MYLVVLCDQNTIYKHCDWNTESTRTMQFHCLLNFGLDPDFIKWNFKHALLHNNAITPWIQWCLQANVSHNWYKYTICIWQKRNIPKCEITEFEIYAKLLNLKDMQDNYMLLKQYVEILMFGNTSLIPMCTFEIQTICQNSSHINIMVLAEKKKYVDPLHFTWQYLWGLRSMSIAVCCLSLLSVNNL